jgi:hypothetical protein
VSRHSRQRKHRQPPTQTTPTIASADALAARQTEARAALRRLGDCSRNLDRIGATSRTIPPDAQGDRVKQLVRALTIEAARLRVELRNWDVASAQWLGSVNVRLDRLAKAIATVSQADLRTVSAPVAAVG